MTLGLATLFINAGMLYLTEWGAHELDLKFDIDNFWSAILAALIISVASFVLTKVLK